MVDIDLDNIKFDNIKFQELKKQLMQGHYEYQGFIKNYMFQLKIFIFAFVVLMTFNSYTIITNINKDEMLTVVANLILIIFNTFMATNSYNRIKIEKLKSVIEDKDYNNLMSHMDKFEKERGIRDE